MATFSDEPALPTDTATWNRVKSLVAAGKTVEVYRKTVSGTVKLYLRVWSGKRKDGSNLVNADPAAEY